MPKVSVVIPVHNVEAYLRQCLDSVVNQTLQDIEMICVDDGSTDGSAAILAEYAAKEPRMHVLTQDCAGAGPARNHGMAQAHGRYLAFVDADDFMDADTLERRLLCAEETGVDIVISGFKRYDATGLTLRRRTELGPAVEGLPKVFAPAAIADSLFTAFLPAPWNKFYRTSFVRDRGLQFQALSRCNDVCFTMSSLSAAERLTVLSETGYCYREGRPGGAQSTSGQDPTCVCKAYLAVLDYLRRTGRYSIFKTSFYKAAVSSILQTLGILRDYARAHDLFGLVHKAPYADLLAVKLTESDYGSNVADFRRYRALVESTSYSEFLFHECGYLHGLVKDEALLTQRRLRELVAANQLIAAKDARIEDYEARIKARTKELVAANQLIAAKDARIEDYETRIKSRTKELVAANQLIAAKDARIEDLEKRIKDRMKELVAANQLIAAKDARIEALKRRIENICRSLPYRLGLSLLWPARKVRGLFEFLCRKGDYT